MKYMPTVTSVRSRRAPTHTAKHCIAPSQTISTAAVASPRTDRRLPTNQNFLTLEASSILPIELQFSPDPHLLDLLLHFPRHTLF
jgi:hypothetical protein